MVFEITAEDRSDPQHFHSKVSGMYFFLNSIKLFNFIVFQLVLVLFKYQSTFT